MRVQILSRDPEILLLRDFVSQDEASCLMRQAESHFVSSRVTCSKAEGCVSDYRTSSTAYLPPTKVGGLIADRGMRFARLGYAEELQIVRYFPGQEFKPHLDAFDPQTFEGRQELAGFGGRQRDATLLIYLNRPEAGGSTRFTNLGLDVAPEPGAALYWRNIDASGRIDQRTMHAGLPVRTGVKFAINLWLRGTKALAGLGPEAMLSREALTGKRNFVSVPVTLGKIGEFKPSAEEDAKRFAIPFEKKKYTGTGYTLVKMASYIRDGSVSPAMRQFAEMVIRNAGVDPSTHLSNAQAAQILLTYVKKNVRYRPDPDNMELVQSPFITLCVPGAQMCIPIEDCDGLVVATGSLMGAYGIPVRIMKQSFGADAEEEHVLIVFKTDDGKWLPADPSAPLDKGVGWMANDSSHIVVDPLDPEGTGTPASDFVGIGGHVSKFELTFVGQLPPRRMIGLSSQSYAANLQDIVANQSTRVALAVEACAANLDNLTKANWDVLAQRALTFASQDPSVANPDEGKAVLADLNTFAHTLAAGGCSTAADVPVVVAPIPPIVQPGTDWEGLAKLGLYTLMAGVAVYGLGQVIEIIKLSDDVVGGVRGHLRPAASEARRLMRGAV